MVRSTGNNNDVNDNNPKIFRARYFLFTMKGLSLTLNTLIAVVGFLTMNYINTVDEKIDGNKELIVRSITQINNKLDKINNVQTDNAVSIGKNETDIFNLRLTIAQLTN